MGGYSEICQKNSSHDSYKPDIDDPLLLVVSSKMRENIFNRRINCQPKAKTKIFTFLIKPYSTLWVINKMLIRDKDANECKRTVHTELSSMGDGTLP